MTVSIDKTLIHDLEHPFLTFVVRDLESFGIEASLSGIGSAWRIIFSSNEDMNFYKLVGKIKESPAVIFELTSLLLTSL